MREDAHMSLRGLPSAGPARSCHGRYVGHFVSRNSGLRLGPHFLLGARRPVKTNCGPGWPRSGRNYAAERPVIRASETRRRRVTQAHTLKEHWLQLLSNNLSGKMVYETSHFLPIIESHKALTLSLSFRVEKRYSNANIAIRYSI